jgi:hypothetical protein
LKKELKRATDKSRKEYLESISGEITEIQKGEFYNSKYMKTRELGWKNNHGTQTIGIRDSSEYKSRHVLKIWENYVTQFAIELIDR